MVDGQNAISLHGSEWWLQHICRTIQLIWLALQWQYYAGEGSTRAKQKHVDAGYLRGTTNKPDLKALRKTKEYMLFKRRFEATMTGATRVLLAYETVSDST